MFIFLVSLQVSHFQNLPFKILEAPDACLKRYSAPLAGKAAGFAALSEGGIMGQEYHKFCVLTQHSNKLSCINTSQVVI